jgi:hypothetical protein
MSQRHHGPRHLLRYWAFATALGGALWAQNARAQDTASSKAEAPVLAAQAPSPDHRTVEERFAAQEERMRTMESELRGRIDTLEAEAASANATQDEFGGIGSGEDFELQAAAQSGKVERNFSIYGFFDITFFKMFYADNSAMNLWLNESSSFVVNNLNIYFQSQMTKTLGALVELRFSFLPHGLERSFEAATVAEDGTVIDIPTENYVRENTWQRDSYVTETYWAGSVGIERVYLKWTPREWFNLIVGRYLTPTGIWNVDHASTVVLPAHIPYMHLREMTVRAQTGLEAYGTFFPSSRWTIDYALTLSNGRGGGVIEGAVIDYDDNKAVGLRLRLSYENPNFSFAAGGYGYYGETTDQKKKILINSAQRSLSMKVIQTENYFETNVTADLQFKLYGVTLQSEYVWHRVDFKLPAKLQYREKVMVTGDPLNTVFGAASYLGQGVYALLYWELPLDRWLGDFKIIPFAMVEINTYIDINPWGNQKDFFGGFNLRPSPYLTLKLEYMFVKPEDRRFSSEMHGITAQAAVSF